MSMHHLQVNSQEVCMRPRALVDIPPTCTGKPWTESKLRLQQLAGHTADQAPQGWRLGWVAAEQHRSSA